MKKFAPGFILIYYGLAAVVLFFLIATLAPEIGKQLGKLSLSKQQQESRAAGTEGRVRYFEKMVPTFDSFATTAAGQNFANAHYRGGLMFYPHSDSYTWYTNGEGFFYRDSYGLSVGGDHSGLGMSEVIKNQSGQPCYLPDHARYVGDAGSSNFRTTMISEILSRLNDSSKGQYDGVYLDDVNLDMNAAMDCGGSSPVDPRTGQAMTADNWKRYIVEYLEQVRSATSKKIFHNSVSYSVWPYSDPLRIRSIKAANYIEMEFAFVDTGLSNGGSGDKYSWQAKMDWIDFVHSNGASLLHQNYWHGDDNLTPQQERFGLGMYLLTSNGTDYFATFDGDHPDNWNPAHDADLGSATNGRYQWNGLLRRDFTGGFVVVNPIGGSTKTVSLGGNYESLYGGVVNSVTLNARDTAIFKSTQPAPLPPPTNLDSDGDGFTDSIEVYLGTSPTKKCGGDGWPADLWDRDRSANKLDIQDITSFTAPTRILDTVEGDAKYNKRWDLNGDKRITIQDITLLTNLAPPMFNNTRAFDKKCTT